MPQYASVIYTCVFVVVSGALLSLEYAKPIAEPIPAPKEVDLGSIRFAADRIDPEIHFTDDALQNFIKVPRPFLKTVLNGCVTWAKENGVTTITDKEVKKCPFKLCA